MNTAVLNWELFKNLLAPLIELFGKQIFWLLMWGGVVIFLLQKEFFLGLVLILSGIAKFYLLCRKEYRRGK